MYAGQTRGEFDMYFPEFAAQASARRIHGSGRDECTDGGSGMGGWISGSIGHDSGRCCKV